MRIDELALQRHGITVETLDMAEVIGRVKAMNGSSAYRDKAQQLRETAAWDGVPERAFDHIAELGVVLDEIIDQYQMDAVAIRCWLDLQQQLGISPCVVLGTLNDQGTGGACEVDLGSAVALRALHLASGEAATCLDWNNNFEDEDDKCILFHCGPVPASLMAQPGRIADHAILINTIGEGLSYGCNVGASPRLISRLATCSPRMRRLRWYLGHGASRGCYPAGLLRLRGRGRGGRSARCAAARDPQRAPPSRQPDTRVITLASVEEALHGYLDHDVFAATVGDGCGFMINTGDIP